MSYHQLMAANHTIFTKMVFERLAGSDLSVGQPKILEYLFTHDGAIQKEIAEACQIEPATVTSLLSRMEKNGLVERKNRSGDRRYLCVHLTETGRKYGRLSVETLEAVEETALAGFSHEEREQFIAYLRKVNDNLTKRKVIDSNE